jgi:SAM-dependent methyltransferase
MSPREKFLDHFERALKEDRLVKLTLSEPLGATAGLRNVYARPVELAGGRCVQFVHRHARRDVTKNVPPAEAGTVLETLLGQEFARGYLFTTTGDFQWAGPEPGKLKASRPSFASAPSLEHDRIKPKVVSHAPWLVALGVTAPDGSARPGMADKLRQIERFVEILGHEVENSGLRGSREIHVADLGAGKGYLTFATHEFFKKLGIPARITGIEARADLVEVTNRIARECGCQGLEFVAGDITHYTPESLDLLIALHACDTATDDALHLGLRAGAKLLLAAPCCHRELRPQIATPAVLAPVLRHGILLEREAEILTDAIRALLLEIHGCAARVFEFISSEHTGKNLMIAARRLAKTRDPAPLRAQLRELLSFHGLREQRLAKLLGEL